MPAHACQLALRFGIALLVAFHLILPKWGVGFGQGPSFAALVAMPKAAVNKDASAVFAQNQIGMAWQATVV